MGFVEAYATLSAAIETAKLVAAGSAALSTAELQMRVNEITNALWTANNSLHEAQQEIRERDAEIARLNEALEIRGRVVRAGNAYYLANSRGQPNSAPFCQRCWEVDHRLLSLARGKARGEATYCPQCKAQYVDYLTERQSNPE